MGKKSCNVRVQPLDGAAARPSGVDVVFCVVFGVFLLSILSHGSAKPFKISVKSCNFCGRLPALALVGDCSRTCVSSVSIHISPGA